MVVEAVADQARDPERLRLGPGAGEGEGRIGVVVAHDGTVRLVDDQRRGPGPAELPLNAPA